MSTTEAVASTRRTRWVAGAVLLQLVLLPLAVFGQLSARLTGEEYLIEVGPVDPIDPFRGAYVELSYPDLQTDDAERSALDRAADDERRGTIYIALEEKGDVMVASEFSRTRPSDGPYLACTDDWRPRCGIESLFLSEADAARVQKDIDQSGFWQNETEEYDENGNLIEQPRRHTGYAAKVKVDGRGHAAVVDLVEL